MICSNTFQNRKKVHCLGIPKATDFKASTHLIYIFYYFHILTKLWKFHQHPIFLFPRCLYDFLRFKQVLHPVTGKLNPALTFCLDSIAIGACCFCSGKSQTMTAHWINMQFCRNIQSVKCLEKQQGVLYRYSIIRCCMPQESRRGILRNIIFQGQESAFLFICIILSQNAFKRTLCAFSPEVITG